MTFRASKSTDKVIGLANEVSSNSHFPVRILDLEKLQSSCYCLHKLLYVCMDPTLVTQAH